MMGVIPNLATCYESKHEHLIFDREDTIILLHSPVGIMSSSQNLSAIETEEMDMDL